uniref:Uncharacterized protein n=1 Tax=Oryza rufipogon TaxID=4529 RepID=A0A0E0PZT5_ORYRU
MRSPTFRSRMGRTAARPRGVKTWEPWIPRRAFHRGSELGMNTMDRSAKPHARKVSGVARAARWRSYLVYASMAASREEMTTLVARPSLSVITGPWTRARSLSLWWNDVPPAKWRLPMSGSGVGPGGRGLPPAWRRRRVER